MPRPKVSLVKVGGFRPTGDLLATHFGLNPSGRPDEEWPIGNESPLLFVCQLNLLAAPVVPTLLQGIALITFFVDPSFGSLGQENGENWRLRAYPSVQGLIPLRRPAGVSAFKRGFECSWLEAVDSRDDAHTKLGGKASTIQGDLWWNEQDHPADPRFCLQINSEEKVGLTWGHGGLVYLARGAADGAGDRWFLDWQCY